MKNRRSKNKKKNVEQKKKCGCCKWALGSLLIIALIAGALIYDTETNGKGVFAKSATGKVLQNAGLLTHVEKGWYTTMSAGARGYKWAEKNVPPVAKPICALICDLVKLARNTACNIWTMVHKFVNSKLPVMAEFVEQYLPGFPEKLSTYWTAAKEFSVDVFAKTLNFFKTQVFVGRLSPENINKALNATQNVALDYYNQFHKKVDAYAKLK